MRVIKTTAMGLLREQSGEGKKAKKYWDVRKESALLPWIMAGSARNKVEKSGNWSFQRRLKMMSLVKNGVALMRPWLC
jgi:hypothetical protein